MPALKNLFSLRSIGAKLALMTVVGAICMALVASTVLWIARNQLVTERIEKAHAAVDIVWNLADGYYQAYRAGQMTEEEAKKRFLEANNTSGTKTTATTLTSTTTRPGCASPIPAFRDSSARTCAEQGRQRHSVRRRP